MKKLAFILLILSCNYLGIIAQPCGTPPLPFIMSNDGINYQTIIRDTLGNILTNKNISLKISLENITPCTNPNDYIETFNLTTNQYGLVNIVIGSGNVISGDFSKLDWSLIYFMNIYVDINGGNNYTLIGGSTLKSVPYALYAKTSGSGPTGPTGATGATGPTGPTGATITTTNFQSNGQLIVTDGSGNHTTPQSAWLTTGNTGIINNTNFFGTINNTNLVFKTNNTERMRLLSTGQGIFNNTVNINGDVFSAYTSGIATNLGTTAISGYGLGANSIGLYGQSNGENGFGLIAKNFNNSGTGMIACGNDIFTVDVISQGSGGTFTGNYVGLYSYAKDYNTGTGILGVGNNTIPPSPPVNGCGGAFIANYIGVYGEAKEQSQFPISGGSWGGVFVAKGGAFSNVAGWSFDTDVSSPSYLTWVNYKIRGNGVVSTIVDDTKGNEVTMFAPEAPEVLFQDKGQAKLINGRTHVTIDPIFTKNIVVDEKHPLSVMIQPEGDCKGVYVTNKSATGFDVIELSNGSSNIDFTWFITASRADKTYTDKDGFSRVSSFSKVRFPKDNSRIETKQLELKKIDIKSSQKIIR